jgi:hypothetical protein
MKVQNLEHPFILQAIVTNFGDFFQIYLFFGNFFQKNREFAPGFFVEKCLSQNVENSPQKKIQFKMCFIPASFYFL